MAALFRFFRQFSYWHWLVLVLALVALDYLVLDASRVVDQRAGDLLLRQHAAGRPVSDTVTVIDVDQRSLEEMAAVAGSWPWPRSVHGELVAHLARQKPRAIVFDIMFNEPDVYRPEHDALFADTVAAYPNVYQPLLLSGQGGGAAGAMPPALGFTPLPGASPAARLPVLLPLVLIRHPEAMRGGLINFVEDSDRVGRHYYLYRDHANWRLPALPGRLARDFGWPQPAADRILLNWRSGWRHVSYADLYADAQREHPLRPADEFRDRIVVIGTAAPGLQDLRVTPLAATYPGVDILATAIDNLRAGDWLREPPRAAALPLAAVLLIVLARAFSRGLSATRIAYALLAASLAVVALAWFALRQGWWLPVYAPLACAWVFYWLCALQAYLGERRQRERAIGMFQRFLDPRVVGDLVARGEIDTGAIAESREITVLFSDIRGFTTLSETRSPEAIVSLLNRYFSTQVEIIFRHGGTLDKFIGDAIMAFWGAPVHDPDHARHAVAAAIEMSQALVRFKAELTDLGQDFDIGIGLNSGPAVVGFVGSNDRLDYTAIGDTVNLASRIEGQTKGVARVLVAESTRLAAGEAFAYRDCGLHHVKGREQEVRLFEPIPQPEE
ncbi:adenylate/guanylate cyclase domain-containing protein [Chitinimonas koreensis]|uniref:adenylate/guanylate cyclase domain-containing protein n=1 Tax=Chitinimonas koreensis TaxID=356302 RepID=UPI000420D8EF|nr:adenylate/guanylate cyclase domain-containing protein [Chitinimonas koreensis]